MEVDYVEAQIANLEIVMGKMDADAADRMRALAHADDLELFWIVNTADRKAFFLARSARLARHAAVAANHIQDVNNGDCFQATENFYKRDPGFGSSVRRAIKDRVPGAVVKKGQSCCDG